ncbi:polysaccharide deacetylase family protein [Paenibacillus selenitireducens]|uniref:Polysaccharide deacetylase family protein n=1 Tax=Paenibacillus selenitireducens TaxID=1324314 RepID=A0A1T2XKU1_9BACL|nr:polysaccharide deacetylase family protein [Paenibacillus selenitireducens]OPA80428.1 polysaccharide deacetylase family protein [Paenibacillus selenitireducens]
MENLVLWCFYILTFYAFLPGVFSRIFGFRVFKRGQSEREICLTFDDGPDAHYTEELLDLLKRFDAKATFFVVGVNAEKNPAVIKRIHDEGHLIGIHNYVHKSNWFMRPGTVRKQIKKTTDIIHHITGSKTIYYRPPWGIVNLFDFGNLGHIQIILWSAMFGDWRKRVGVDRLERRLMRKLRPGEVLLLHDCGTTFGADPEAPGNMLVALERYMKAAEAKDYQFVRVDEMMKTTDRFKSKQLSLGKKALVKAWLVWEQCFHVLFNLKKTADPDPTFHYRVTTFHGESITMQDGNVLHKGDQVMEIHFDNQKLFDMGMNSRSTVHIAIQLIRGVEKALPYFAEEIVKNPQLSNVKALYGVSMIHRGADKLGFSVHDLPKGLFATLTQMYLKILLSVIHPKGKSRVKDRSTALVPKSIVLSAELLKKRYDVGTHIQNGKEVEEVLQEKQVLKMAVEQTYSNTPNTPSATP